MKIKGQINSGLQLLLAVFVALFIGAGVSDAQEPTWWGSSSWFDWSDFRGSANARLYFARFVSGSIKKNGIEYDLKSSPFSMGSDPQVIREAWFELYVDRLGLRLLIQDHQFTGKRAPGESISHLDFGAIRVGLDLDLVRYPFFRSGIDFDYSMEAAKFNDRSGNSEVVFSSAQPMTIGLHATAIPGRVRDIPIIIEARARGPIPFYKQSPNAKVIDWEVSGGLRPSVWQTSLYGYSTFAFGIEGGFRSLQLNMDIDPDVSGLSQASIKANWQGAFVQLGVSF
ncbi:MAG: hypothetical protein HY912_03920 [Desulfomonile tiedjei]|uniref:Uncharacterized protein n=1 Tax=Desulfomonile tiedjei TaxID=2358 RepID=A0A9D6V0U0_9BACT|nr:hypothetical protein [Desulfomonile tiedjei]